MQIPALDAAALADVRAKLAHRFPQSATLRPPADRGVGAVEIPIVLGNPSGACRMPAGSFVSDAWAQYIRGALTGVAEDAGLAEDLARDCILLPDAAVVDEILTCWPALAPKITAILNKKIGRGVVEDPKHNEKPPAPIAAWFEGHPRAAWRWVRPARGDAYSLIVEPPGAAEYDAFNEGMRQRKADVWKLTRDFVAGSTPAVFDTAGNPVALEALLTRLPGVAISLALAAAQLGGIDAEAELGE